MLSRRLRQVVAGTVRRLTAALLAVAYLVSVIGLPLPAGAARPGGGAFPCQGHACGCLSAEECWHHCCCFSPAEQLAWARANGVQPPADAQCLQADQGWNTRPQREREEAAHCGEGCGGACCKAKKEHASCCEEATSKPAGRSWTIGVLRLRCHGLTTLWALTGAALPPPAPALSDLACCEAVPAFSLHPPQRPSTPESPPPRIAVS
jgi:hypothetical protein